MIERPNPPATRTLTLVCACGERQVFASGYNAEAVTPERLAEFALKYRWTLDPEVCPGCRGEEPVRSTRKEWSKNK